MAQVIKLEPGYLSGTYLMNSAEAHVIRGFSQSQGRLLSRIGNAEKGRKWWALKDYSLLPCWLPRLASLMTKIDGINFEHYVLCDDP